MAPSGNSDGVTTALLFRSPASGHPKNRPIARKPSYAKQADDDELEKFAMRVKARAIRRCGELLQTYEAKQGERTDLQLRGDTSPKLTRTSAARDAGLSDDQRKTALRVASLPQEDFTEAIESDDPPTITALAERGTKKNPLDIGDRDPADFQAATQALGAFRSFVEMTQQCDIAAIVRGSDAREQARMMALFQELDGLLPHGPPAWARQKPARPRHHYCGATRPRWLSVAAD